MLSRRNFLFASLAYLTTPLLLSSRSVSAGQGSTYSLLSTPDFSVQSSPVARICLPVWNDVQGTIYVENSVGDKLAISWDKTEVKLVKNGIYNAEFIAATSPIRTYYVDAINGNDANSGLSQALAWKTIKKINSHAFQPGDAIYFKCGCLWREQLFLRASGIQSNPITLGSFGTGLLPVISGANILDKWTKVSGFVYKSPCSLEPNQVFSNHYRLTYKMGLKQNLATNQWDYVKEGAGYYVYINVGSTPSGKLVEVTQRQTCCTAQDCSYMIIDSIHFDKGNEHGLFITEYKGPSEHVIIRNCTASRAFFRGIYHWDSQYASNNFVVENNKVFDCGGFGIAWTKFANGGIIRRNRVYLNGALSYRETGRGDHQFQGGIAIFGNQIDVRNIVVEYNESYQNGRAGQPDTGGNGIWIDECMEGNIVRFNRVFDNAGCGIVAENSPHGGEIYCNIIYGNGHGVAGGGHGLFLSRGDQNWRIFNNTLYKNNEGITVADFLGTGNPYNNIIKNNIAVGSTLRNLRVESTGIANTVKYNCFGAQRSNFIKWGGVQYNSYLAWEKACPSNHSIQQEPTFVDIANKDFRMAAGFPYGGGENIPLIPVSAGGTPFATNPDVGAFSRLSGVTLDFTSSFLGLKFSSGQCASLKVWATPMSTEYLVVLTR